MIFRRQIGFLTALFYVASFNRRRIIKKCCNDNLVVPALFHSPTPEFLDNILTRLSKLVGLKNVELTFDDGRAAIKDCIKVLEKHNKKAVLFISPGEIERSYNWAEYASRAFTKVEFQKLMRLSAEERYKFIDENHVTKGNLLTIDDIVELSKHPLVEFGNHTYSHISCANRPVQEVLDEIELAQCKIEEWTGKRPVKFSYPFGHDSEELDILIRKSGLVPYALKTGLAEKGQECRFRNMAVEDMTILENVARLLTAWPKVKRMPS